MSLDAIALATTCDLDRVYPPMRWTAKWSDGANIPFGLTYPRWIADAFMATDFYPAGLWLFSDEGHGHRVPDLGQQFAGRTVIAWNRREAEARLRVSP